MNGDGELFMRAQSEAEPILDGPRDGDETEVTEKGGGGGESKRAQTALFTSGPRDGDETEKTPAGPLSSLSRIGLGASDPREGDETETSERGGGSKGQIFTAQGDPRDGDETTPIRESPLGPPVRV
jgi:hypothetical protein